MRIQVVVVLWDDMRGGEEGHVDVSESADGGSTCTGLVVGEWVHREQLCWVIILIWREQR